MSKKVYVIKEKNKSIKLNLFQIIVGIIVYACVLIFASNLFKHMYIENFWYALLASLIISILNYAIKPFLIYFTMPLNILTFGITYPLINVIILKICDVLMGDAFSVSGFFALPIIAIFISLLKIIFDTFITNRIGDNK